MRGISWCVVLVRAASVAFDGSDSSFAGSTGAPLRRSQDVGGVTDISVSNGEYVSVGNGCNTFD